MIRLQQLSDIWGEPFDKTGLDLSTSLGPVCTDSREIIEGSFFVPLIGDRFNGHDFLSQAFNRGAQAAVVSRKYIEKVPERCPHWLVEDTLEAYQRIALLHRCDLELPVIAITGSVGKTTTRELIKEVISPLGEIISSSANNNNDIGVPLTLLQAKRQNAAIVLEMGMRGFGEIHRLSCCTLPDIAVITNIGTAHIGRLGSRKNIAKAKCEITNCLKPNGVVVIPANDPLLEEVLIESWKGKVVRISLVEASSLSFGRSEIVANSNSLSEYLLGNLNLEKEILEVDGQSFRLPLEGRHNAINFMLALAVAKELGLSLKEINDFRVKTSYGRNNRFGFGGITILDETYNASPESVKASLELLVSKRGRHFAVLGTMLELGEHSIELHRQVAKWAVDLGLDGLVVIAEGSEAEAMKIEARNLPRLAIVSTVEEAFSSLHPWIRPGDTVLLKASRVVELEKIFPFFFRHFERH